MSDKTKEPATSEGTSSNDTQHLSKSITSKESLSSDLSEKSLKNEEVEKAGDVIASKYRHWWYVVYPESAPSDWIEQLINRGTQFCVSPLHDKDVNPDGSVKKAHYHVIVSWGNTTTFATANALAKEVLNCPRPQHLVNVNAAFKYHRHLDNPEKYQYEEMSVCYNGWEKPIDKDEIAKIKREIVSMIMLEDIVSYGELLAYCQSLSVEFGDVAINNTVFCNNLCSSYRFEAYAMLLKFKNALEADKIQITYAKYTKKEMLAKISNRLRAKGRELLEAEQRRMKEEFIAMNDLDDALNTTLRKSDVIADLMITIESLKIRVEELEKEKRERNDLI